MYHRNNWVLNDTHSFKTKSHAFSQQLFYWLHFVIYFLHVSYPITNNRFTIKYFCCSINYKMREVKKYRYLQIPQLIFGMPTYTHNPYLTQCQSILLMTLLCMLTPIWRPKDDLYKKKLKYKYHNQYEIFRCYKEITTTHKHFYQPLFSSSSYYVLNGFHFVLFSTAKQLKTII